MFQPLTREIHPPRIISPADIILFPAIIIFLYFLSSPGFEETMEVPYTP
jgi:hypothetical protein